MKNLPLLVLALVLAFAASAAVAGGSGWQTDFDKAVKKARKCDRPILVEFTDGAASKKLNKEIFYKSKFQTWAKKNVVLLELNYGKRLSKKLTAQYAELKQQYKVEEFPTVLLIDTEGKVLGRPAYTRAGVDAWLKNVSDTVAAASSAGTWMTDYEKAKKIARRSQKTLLLNFDGSDW